jgi:RNA polymerase-binding transcription factor DksA
MQNQVNRYSQAELEEFRLLIQKKIDVSNAQVENMVNQIQEITEGDDEHGTDIIDDSNTISQVEMLGTMVSRQRKHIGDLENALIRIKNKSYGICVVTGELIDKRRLMAVLTTTKSLAGKTMEATPVKKLVSTPKPSSKPQSFTRIIKKASTTPVVKKNELVDDFLDDDDDDNDDIDFDDNDNFIDPDSLSEDDLD